MRTNGPLALIFHTIFVIIMLAPILVVCLVAFTPEGYLSLPTSSFSLRWFRAIANYPEFVHAFWVSLGLGALSSLVALLFAVPAALAIARYHFRGRDALAALFLSPLMIPHVVLGIAFLRFFTAIGMGGSFAGLLVAHVVVVFPFALRLTLAAATGMDRSIEMAAVSLGAGDWTLFRRVTLPLILPGVISGWALAFIQSFDDLTMTVFLATPGTETLPVRMFLYIQDNIDPLVTSVSATVIAITMTALILLDRFYGLDRVLAGKSDPGGVRRTRGKPMSKDYDVAVVGGGLLGSAIAWGLGRLGKRVVVLDEGDIAKRASRANFALVWVQSKGLGMPAYTGWTMRASESWGKLAAELKDQTGLDVALQQNGGFHLTLGEGEFAQRARLVTRMHNQVGAADYGMEMLSAPEVKKMLPLIGPEVSGGSFCPLGRTREFAAHLPRVPHRTEAVRRRLFSRAAGLGDRPERRRIPALDIAGRNPRRQGRALRRQRQPVARTDGRALGADGPDPRPDRGDRAHHAVPAASLDHHPSDRRGHGDDRRQQGRSA